MKKILFVIPSFSGGGAERVLINILKYIDRKRFNPLVVTFTLDNDYRDELPDDLDIRCLGKKNALDSFRLVLKLAKIIRKEKPSLIVSFLSYTNYLTIAASKLSRTGKPVVISERNTLSKSLSWTRFGFLKRILTNLLYRYAAGIITVSEGVKEDLCGNFKVSGDKCRVIYNPVDIEKIDRLAKENIEHPWYREDIPVVAACGRLIPQKNYPLLLKAMAGVMKKTAARLVILGTGGKQMELERLAGTLGIEENVFFAGFKKNPYKYIAGSDIFVLSSDWEGCPNALLEAMACGTAVISTSCPSGPKEILSDGLNGILVPVGDIKAMADGVLRLIRDENFRKSLAQEGKKRCRDFDVKKIVKEYEKVFSGCI